MEENLGITINAKIDEVRVNPLAFGQKDVAKLRALKEVTMESGLKIIFDDEVDIKTPQVSKFTVIYE